MLTIRWTCRIALWGMALALGIATLLTVTACGEKSPRNFNELIPRLMGTANRYQNPTDAAAALFNVTSPDERRDAIAYLETKKYGHEPAYMRAYEILTRDPHPMVRAQAMRAWAPRTIPPSSRISSTAPPARPASRTRSPKSAAMPHRDSAKRSVRRLSLPWPSCSTPTRTTRSASPAPGPCSTPRPPSPTAP